ncbi:MAG TPA: ABC transporter permease, partial [Rhizobiaceae bacterium]|nr:ABC transporter permease [Rhizobiaceae bacterium]
MNAIAEETSGAKAPDTGRRRALAAAGAAERAAWLLIAPLLAVLAFFLVLPIATIVMVSFWGSNEFTFFPAFIFDNYAYLLTSKVTLDVYLTTLKYVLLSWFFCTLIGFTVAYFLAFHVHSTTAQTVLFLVCTIPFWTSNIIRMISWIPFLGRNGLANSALMNMGLIDAP